MDSEEYEWERLADEGTLLVLAIAASYLVAIAHPPRIVESACKFLALRHKKRPRLFKMVYVVVNLTQIFTCTWIVVQIIKFGDMNESIFHCHRKEMLESRDSHQMVSVCWIYHLLNVLGILDTVHLKIRGRKLIFLHVYHHTIAIIWSWLVFKIYPGGHNILFILGIASTHAVMYSYYLATLTRVRMNRPLCWKLITLLQIGWIIIGLAYMSFLYFNGCPYPKSLQIFSVVASSVLLFSFLIVFTTALRAECHSNASTWPGSKKK